MAYGAGSETSQSGRLDREEVKRRLRKFRCRCTMSPHVRVCCGMRRGRTSMGAGLVDMWMEDSALACVSHGRLPLMLVADVVAECSGAKQSLAFVSYELGQQRLHVLPWRPPAFDCVCVYFPAKGACFRNYDVGKPPCRFGA